MRGNETNADSLRSDPVPVFPIPMRGNEIATVKPPHWRTLSSRSP